MKILTATIVLLISALIILFTVLISEQGKVKLSDRNYDEIVYIIDPNNFDIKIDSNMKILTLSRNNPQGSVELDLSVSQNYENVKTSFDVMWEKIADGDDFRLIPTSTCPSVALKYDKKGNLVTLICRVINDN